MNDVTNKYFRSFASESYPIQPREELSLSDAQKLTTYYEAKYDTDNQLREVVKHLRQSNLADSEIWVTAFVERYEYWPSHRLKTRSLVGPNGADQSWHFDDLPFKWTRYLNDWFENWFGRSNPIAIPSFADRVCACHELINQMESGLFCSGESVRNLDRARTEITESLSSFKALFETLLPGSGPRVSLVTSTGNRLPHFLSGFDEMLNFGVLEDTWNYLASRREFSPFDILASKTLDSDARNWLQANDILASFAIPIRVFLPAGQRRVEKSGADPTGPRAAENLPALSLGNLVLWLKAVPSDVELAGLMSIFHRQAIFIQFAIQTASDFVDAIWGEQEIIDTPF